MIPLLAAGAAAWFGLTPEPRSFVAYSRYSNGTIFMKVNSMTSDRNPIPYDYYKHPFCPLPNFKVETEADNVGEVLWGDRVQLSPYYVTMMEPRPCSKLCTMVMEKKKVALLKRRIDRGYRLNFLLDHLPLLSFPDAGTAATAVSATATAAAESRIEVGVRLGMPALDKPTVLHNHIDFVISYHKPQDDPPEKNEYRIVGFYASSRSIDWKDPNDCRNQTDMSYPKDAAPVRLNVESMKDDEKLTVHFSYRVTWREDRHTRYRDRWTVFFEVTDSGRARVHWFALVNSLLVLLFLSGIVAVILLRALHKDFNYYNDPDRSADAQEEIGWKLVHADVFRRPPRLRFLVSLVGTGAQLWVTVAGTLLLSLTGAASSGSRGTLLTASLLLFALLGTLSGYVAARLSKLWGVASWATVLTTGTLFPGTLFAGYVVINFVLWGRGAANALSFQTMAILVLLWLVVSLPLVVIGAVVGYKRPALEHPVMIGEIPKQVPVQPCFLMPSFACFAAGALPFAATLIEIYFVLNSLWLHKFYHLFGFLAAVFGVLSVTVAEITIVFVYFQLCYEDWRVWWRAFLYGASPGVYLFVYSITFFATRLRITYGWSTMVYFGFMGLLSYTVSVMTGAIGWFAAFFFVRSIYGNIRVD